MKLLTLLAILTLASCAAPDSWANTPNPLDTPETTYIRPPAIGYFGPHAEYFR